MIFKEGPFKKQSNCNVVYSCKYHVVWCPKYRRPVLMLPQNVQFLISENVTQL